MTVNTIAGQPVAAARGLSWQDQALCAYVDPDLWFPDKGESGSTRAAKRICNSCPVREQCLAYALDLGFEFGIWGGTTEYERRALRQQRRAAA